MLEYDPIEAVALLRKADKTLATVIRRAGAFTMRPKPMQSPFQSLLQAIAHQQLSGKAAATIYGRLLAEFPGRGGATPQAILDASEERLRATGMSRAKVAAVKDLAAKTLDGTVPTLARLKRMSDDEILERIVQVRGIGRWTVEMMLIFRLGRGDVLPTSDYGIRNGFRIVYGGDKLPGHRDMMSRSECWRPYRSVASWYLWRAVELDRNTIAAKAAASG